MLEEQIMNVGKQLNLKWENGIKLILFYLEKSYKLKQEEGKTNMKNGLSLTRSCTAWMASISNIIIMEKS